MSCRYDRRDFLRQSTALAAAAVTLRPEFGTPLRAGPLRSAPTSPVAIERCTSYEPQVLAQRLGRALDAIGGIESLVSGKTVSIKLNLTGGPHGNWAICRPIETYHVHPHFVAATCAALARRGCQEDRTARERLRVVGRWKK